MITYIGISQARAEAIDFTIPLMENAYTLVVSEDVKSSSLNFWAYTQTYSPEAWMAIFLTFLFLALAISYVSNQVKFVSSESYHFKKSFYPKFKSLTLYVGIFS